MTRQFKKEIVEEATACIRGNMRDGACSYEGVALALMRILADHGALSEEAYEKEPLELWRCLKCQREWPGKQKPQSHFQPGNFTECRGEVIRMCEVKE